MDKSDTIVAQIIKVIDWWEETIKSKEEPITENVGQSSKPSTPSTLKIDPKVKL